MAIIHSIDQLAAARLTLLDGVESLLLGNLELGVGPTGNLDDHY